LIVKDHTEVQVQAIPGCDFCKQRAQYDGKTNMGAWAYMCEAHFRQYGVGVGLGRGQRLILATKPEKGGE